MSYLIFTLIFLAGLLIVLLLSDKFTLLELLGLPLIIGLGYTSFIMFFLDALKLGISYSNIVTGLAITIVIAAGALAFLYTKKRRNLDFLKSQKPSLRGLTLPWLCFVGFGLYLVYGITLKCLYWPPAEFDSIEGYDLLAKAIAHEGTIANSILLNPTIVAGCGPRLLYPPLFASCNAICYLSGMESPKLITALYFISWLVIFYSFIKRFVPHTVAAIATFMMMVAPEMFANASFTLTNLPTAVYASTAVLSFFIWREKKIDGFFYLSILTLLFGTWTRSDAIVFYPGIMLVLLYDAWKTRSIKYLISYGVISVIPFILWHFYLTAHIERQQDSFFIKSFFFDTHKLGNVLSAAWTMIKNTSLYGIIFYVFIPVVLINVVNIYKRRDMLAFLVIAFGGWLLYTMLFYQMKNTDGSLFAPGGWMLSGYKRGMFSFVPLAVFYIATNQYALRLYAKINSWASA
jgi:hypothetical protein